MNKIKKVIKLEDLPRDGIRALLKKYPEGWKDYVRKVTKPSGDYFYAIDVDTPQVSYLIKVNVKVDMKTELDKLEMNFMDKNAEREAANHSGSENDHDLVDDNGDDEDEDEDD
jgi:hypothetical protein